MVKYLEVKRYNAYSYANTRPPSTSLSTHVRQTQELPGRWFSHKKRPKEPPPLNYSAVRDVGTPPLLRDAAAHRITYFVNRRLDITEVSVG